METLLNHSITERKFTMANYMMFRHKVKDFAIWKRGYDAHRAARDAAGLSEKYVLQGADNPNEVIGFLEAADLGRAKAFAESQELKDTMQKVSVTDKPDIYFLTA